MTAPDFSRYECRTHGDAARWAVISHDDKYRYLLGRYWDEGYLPSDIGFCAARPLMVWVMLNPSIADGLDDDPTIRKCIGFAKRHDCGGILVANLFAWRETKPKNIPHDVDIVGPHNEMFLKVALRGPLMAYGIAGWGALTATFRRRSAAMRFWAQSQRPLKCFGKTKKGDPCHPLMLPYSTPMVPV